MVYMVIRQEVATAQAAQYLGSVRLQRPWSYSAVTSVALVQAVYRNPMTVFGCRAHDRIFRSFLWPCSIGVCVWRKSRSNLHWSVNLMMLIIIYIHRVALEKHKGNIVDWTGGLRPPVQHWEKEIGGKNLKRNTLAQQLAFFENFRWKANLLGLQVTHPVRNWSTDA
jgi:hypothetical protein